MKIGSIIARENLSYCVRIWATFEKDIASFDVEPTNAAFGPGDKLGIEDDCIVIYRPESGTELEFICGSE